MPTPPSNVAASSVATSAWANSVVDALNEVLDAIFTADVLTLPWASLTGVPSTFAPAVHDHQDAAGGGTIAYADITGKPSTFTPSAHETSHKTGGTDAFTASEIQGFDRYATTGTVGQKIYVGTTTPSSPTPAEGDIWIKG